MTFYVASDLPLPLVDWRDESPGFHVTPVPEREQAVVAQFTRPHVYYVGSHEQCGCGFEYDEDDYGAPDHKAAAVRSVEALRTYLAEAVRKGASLELYACWDGDWALPAEHRRVLRISEIGGPAFEVAERTFATIAPAAA